MPGAVAVCAGASVTEAATMETRRADFMLGLPAVGGAGSILTDFFVDIDANDDVYAFSVESIQI
jgi:hypothetical protein